MENQIVLPEGVVIALITGFFGLLGVTLRQSWKAASYARESEKHAREANDAINHRHSPESPRAFDMLARLYASDSIHTQRHTKMDAWRDSVDKRLKSQDEHNKNNNETHKQILEAMKVMCQAAGPCKGADGET